MSGDVAQKSHSRRGVRAFKIFKIVSFCNFESLRKPAPDAGSSSLPSSGSDGPRSLFVRPSRKAVQDDLVLKDECCIAARRLYLDLKQAASKHLGELIQNLGDGIGASNQNLPPCSKRAPAVAPNQRYPTLRYLVIFTSPDISAP